MSTKNKIPFSIGQRIQFTDAAKAMPHDELGEIMNIDSVERILPLKGTVIDVDETDDLLDVQIEFTTPTRLWVGHDLIEAVKIDPTDPGLTSTPLPEPHPDIHERMRSVFAIQDNPANKYYDPYMLGLRNGMEFMLSIIENREPQFDNYPDEFLTKRYST